MDAESHSHDYKKLKVFTIKRVQKDYVGTPGDKAFLTRSCKCGKVKAFDYGPTKEMERLLNELEAK